jgi:2-keto-4-pentenoate hydratase/2-oxohepta-3-ene-1,7-dioic acid hydratase in catechol pathway
VDVTAELPEAGRDWRPLIEDWNRWSQALRELATSAGAPHLVLETIRLGPPLPSPASRMFAMGVNFRSHVSAASAAVGGENPVATADAARPPAGFFVIPGTVIGPDDEIVPPPDAQKLDYEAEVAVVLASGGRNLAPEDVRVWGYTAFNDVSIRDPHLGLSRLDEGALAWGLQKNFDGGNICGPSLVIDGDVADVTIVSQVNGEQRQSGSTAQMINSFAQGAAYLSRYLTLRSGDMLTSGTPAGTAIEQGIDGPYLRTGDTIEITVGTAGVLRNRVAAVDRA